LIDERPKIVEEKSRVGDWEGDTVESAGKNAYIATFVNRKTKLLLPDKRAETLNQAVIHAFISHTRSEEEHPDGG
jgi:IS30 family transposase